MTFHTFSQSRITSLFAPRDLAGSRELSCSQPKIHNHLRKKQLSISLCCGVLTSLCSFSAAAASVFINEIHYDNTSGDLNEGIEIFASAGTNLDDWSLLFYNGGDGSIYKTTSLSGSVSDFGNGYGTLNFSISGIQNGPADAVALINSLDELVEFISYEGSVIAAEGAASGVNSIDIGIAENSATPLDWSIQRVGLSDLSNIDGNDFSWIAQQSSFGQFNEGQSFAASAVPIPAASWLYLSAIVGLAGKARKRIHSTL